METYNFKQNAKLIEANINDLYKQTSDEEQRKAVSALDCAWSRFKVELLKVEALR